MPTISQQILAGKVFGNICIPYMPRKYPVRKKVLLKKLAFFCKKMVNMFFKGQKNCWKMKIDRQKGKKKCCFICLAKWCQPLSLRKGTWSISFFSIPIPIVPKPWLWLVASPRDPPVGHVPASPRCPVHCPLLSPFFKKSYIFNF